MDRCLVFVRSLRMSNGLSREWSNEILTTLNEMGDSPTAVAWFLRDCGVMGDPLEPTSCPVAVYLRLRFGVRADVQLTDIQIEDPTSGQRFRIRPPRPIRRFILRFDRGRLPELGNPNSTSEQVMSLGPSRSR
jgi:hypothetical protein